MKFLENLTQKLAKTASTTVADSVKSEAKTALTNAVPVVLTVLAAVAGIVIFKGASKGTGAGIAPAISKMSVTTNNYFFGEALNAETIAKLIDKQ